MGVASMLHRDEHTTFADLCKRLALTFLAKGLARTLRNRIVNHTKITIGKSIQPIDFVSHVNFWLKNVHRKQEIDG